MSLSKNALKVLEDRYCSGDEKARDVFKRVSNALSLGDSKFEKNLHGAMVNGYFMPASPTLRHAGFKKRLLHPCCVLGIEDNIESIFETLKNTAVCFHHGAGVGISFSPLRPKGDFLKSGGETSGVLSFMEIFDKVTESVKEGGFRKGGVLGVLNVNHPEILNFITYKLKDRLSNFNISVMMTDEFMKKIQKNEKIDFINPKDKSVWSSMGAGDLFELIAFAAYSSGDPGLLFYDRINRDNPLYPEKPITAANLCSELPLFENLMCNLGSINVSKFVKGNSFDTKKFAKYVELGTRTLLNINGLSWYPLPEITKNMKEYNPIGLGLCYDDKTEILTDEGWKYFKDLNKKEKVATLNPGSNELEYQKPVRYQILDYNGYMFEYKSKFIDLVITPEHKLYVKNYEREAKFNLKNELERNVSCNFKRDFIWKGKKPDNFTIEGKRYTAENFLKFMGWYLSEGYYTSQNRLGISQMYSSHYYKEIRMLLDNMGLVYSKDKKGFTIRNKELYNYLKIFGKCKDKYVPNFIKELSSDLIKIFLVAYAKGDGTYRSKTIRIYSSSYKMINDLQELIYKSGGTSSIVKRTRLRTNSIGLNPKALPFPKKETCYNLSWLRGRNGREPEFLKKPDIIQYKGKVYDVTVPNHHIIFVRRNGKPIWCSNCGMADLLIKLGVYYDSEEHLKVIDEIKKPYIDITDKIAKDSFYKRSLPPTGSVSILLDCSPATEPIFETIFERHLTIGILEETRELYKSKYVRTAHEVSPDWRLKIQSKWQNEVIDSGISSTVNLRNDATVEEIKDIYYKAWELGLKGITVFRNGSKGEKQVLKVSNRKKCDENSKSCSL